MMVGTGVPKLKKIVPSKSRYVPFTQQQSCCAPTCMLMVMYRHGIPLLPAEVLGYHLGLVVSPDMARLFFGARTSKTLPKSGYGTQIYKREFEPSRAFAALGIPLTFQIWPVVAFATPEDLASYLEGAEAGDRDVLLCFNYGTLTGNSKKNGGHLCVFDRMVDGQIRIVDPSQEQPKWRQVKVEDMFKAMQKHPEQRSAGCWELGLKNPVA